MSAAVAIPAVSASLAAAQSPPDSATLRLQYSDYKDYQSDGDRMHVKAPLVWVQAPIGKEWEVEGSFVLDGMSGASPLYLSTLSGASGTRITDTRKAGDLKLTRYFDGYSIGMGGAYSNEKDYESKSILVDGKVWTPSKNTVFNAGLSVGNDGITSSNDALLDESRNTVNVLAGVSQVMTKRALLQTNVTFSAADGYLSDPYKLFDARPRSRDAAASLTRFALYLPSIDASLHADYRLTYDSWNVSSHMAEISLYKPVMESWLLRPNVRYYTQSAAEFFHDSFPPPSHDGFFSADQRLSAFGGITTGIFVKRELGDGLSVDVEFQFLHQRPDYRPGGGSDNIEPFSAEFLTVGITKKFS